VLRMLCVGLVFVLAAPAIAAPCDIDRSLRAAGGSIDQREVKAFYAALDGGCAWDDRSAETLISVLQAAGDHGLDPALFHIGDAGR
jgi:hypothetical protein